MRFPLYDYLTKCDPLELNFRLLSVFGFWPIEAKTKAARILFGVYGFVTLLFLASLLMLELLDTYIVRHDLLKVTNNLCAASAAFVAVAKQIIVLAKVEQIQQLHKRLKAYKNSRTDPEEVKIMEKADRNTARMMKIMYILGIPCIGAWMFYPVLDFGHHRKLPLPYRLPVVDLSATPVFEIVYTYQCISLFAFLVNIYSVDFIYFGMVTLINAQYEVLIKNINSLSLIVDPESKASWDKCDEEKWTTVHDPVVKRKTRLALRNCFILHQRILGEIQELKLIYSSAYFYHFIGAVTLVGSIIIDITVVISHCKNVASFLPLWLLSHLCVSKGITVRLLQRIIYSACGGLDTYLCCLYTHTMQDESIKLRDAVYSAPWYKLHPKLRKEILMITRRSTLPPLLKIAGCFSLNLETFLGFLKLSYNITALLYQAVN